MANSYNANPIRIDTIMTATSYKAQVASTQGTKITLLVSKIYWQNPQTVGDIMLITDPVSGIELLRLRCEVANQSQIIDWSACPKLWSDFTVDQLDSGTVSINTK